MTAKISSGQFFVFKSLFLSVFFMGTINILHSQVSDSMTVSKQVDSLLDESIKHIEKGVYGKAEISMKNAEQIAKDYLGEKSFHYGKVNYYKGILAYYMNDITLADKFYSIAKGILEGYQNQGSFYYSCISNMVSVKSELGEFVAAEQLNKEAAEIIERSLGKENRSYASVIYGRGFLYLNMANYEKAETYYMEATAIQEKIGGISDPNYLQGLNVLGSIYRETGNFTKAEKFFQKAVALRLQTQGKDHPDYAESLSNLGVLYYDMGAYEKAEPYYLQAKEIWDKLSGPNSDVLTNLGILYEAMGNYSKAEISYQEANLIREKKLGKENQDYAKSLSNLAGFYTATGNNRKIEELLLEAKEIYEKINAEKTPGYANTLTNLSGYYALAGDVKKAEAFAVKVLNIKESVFGTSHYEYARSLRTLGDLYDLKGNYEKSLSFYHQAMGIFESEFGKNHPQYVSCMARVIRIYERKGSYSKSEPMMHEYATERIHRLTQSTSFLSEKELTLYYKTFRDDASEIFSYLRNRQLHLREQGSLPELAYDHILFQKGYLLYAVRQLRQLVKKSPESIELNGRLNGYRRLIAEQLSKETPNKARLMELEEEANQFEKELAKVTMGYSDILKQYSWKEVQESLKAGEAALEFVDFPGTFPEKTDIITYAAILLTSNSRQPKFVSLFDEKDLISILSRGNKRQGGESLAQIYTRGAVPLDQTNNQEGLFELIWKPLEEYLSGVKKIYYSPAGLLHQVNMDAVPLGSGSRNDRATLSDRYTLVRLGSTRSLVVTDTSRMNASNEVVLVGGIQYALDTTCVLEDALIEAESVVSPELSFSMAYRSSATQSDHWNYLPGTEWEVTEISKILHKVHFPFQLLRGARATEEKVKQLGRDGKSPLVLHFATHGYFFPDPKESGQSSEKQENNSVFRISDHPMIRSGLLLSGADYAWKNGRSWQESEEDGILTAYEISQMNLSNTELVVLSACETGLGDIQGNEGVYGLQRAFKIAGAKYLVMSLWQVPDQETSVFMTTFYKHWLEAEGPDKGGNRMSIPDSFRKTQQEMRERFINPYQWAGFVLVE